jgi:hypothetical protein
VVAKFRVGDAIRFSYDKISINNLEPEMAKQTPSHTKLQQRQINHRADSLNPNRGTSGTSLTNAKVHGNRGKQLQPKQK